MATKDLNFLELKAFDNFSDSQFIRVDVVKAILGISRSTFYRLIKKGILKKYNLTPRTAVVNVGDLRRYIQSITEVNNTTKEVK